MKRVLLSITLATLCWSGSVFAQETKEDLGKNLVEACKTDCPKAKTADETHKCAEKKGRLNKDFRKSKCWEINEEYEKKAGGSSDHK